MMRFGSILSSCIRQTATSLGGGLAIAAVLVGLAGQAQAGDLVYMESNQASGNSIMAFRRDASGNLTPIAGSPFPTGGTGISPTFALGPFDSDQEIVVNPEKTLLFAVNGGSDTIAVFHIKANGGLVPVNGSPFPSGGSNPVSLGLAGNVLVVVNKDQDPGHPGVALPNYTTFRIHKSGAITPIADSTVTVDLGSSPSQALISPGNSLVFGADFMGGILRSLAISPKGRLIPADAQPLPPSEFGSSGAPPFPLGLDVHPTKPYLYVGFVTISRIGVYHTAANGKLRFVRTVEDSGNGVCWLKVNKAGTRLYASNTGDNSISVYDLADPAEPVEIQHLVLKGPGNGFQIGLDSENKFCFSISQRASATEPVEANALHVLKIGDDGKLTEVASSPTALPFTDGTRPQGVVAP
jgi:6-phosphogluconolactonase (cycloisomerase 2 family)